MNQGFVERNFGGFKFGLAREFSEAALGQLVAALKKRSPSKKKVLGGRGLVSSETIEGLGSVVIKYYMRGGVLRFFISDRYLRLGSVRPRIEYEIISQVRTLGVNAPEPVAFIVQGSLFYRGWLVTKKIQNQESLAEISLKDEARACQVVKKLTEQVSRLISNGIYHVDLHPGNVLVDGNETVFLVDFDKAYYWRGRKNKLRDLYICRWRRAVIKHGLPETISEWLCAELRRSYE